LAAAEAPTVTTRFGLSVCEWLIVVFVLLPPIAAAVHG
jgi:hypothetical protein